MTETTDDRRSPDEIAALESAFVAGTLPEEDRRAPSAEPTPPYYGVTVAQHARSGDLTKQIGLTVSQANQPYWDELLTIWGHK